MIFISEVRRRAIRSLDILHEFLKDVTETKSEKLCTITLESKHIEEYKKAIDQYYQFEMEYDGIPLFGFVGVVSNSQDDSTPSARRHYYFAHLHFHFLYNKDQVDVGWIHMTDVSTGHLRKHHCRSQQSRRAQG